MVCAWLGEFYSCSCLAVLPGPARVLPNKIFFSILYPVVDQKHFKTNMEKSFSPLAVAALFPSAADPACCCFRRRATAAACGAALPTAIDGGDDGLSWSDGGCERDGGGGG